MKNLIFMMLFLGSARGLAIEVVDTILIGGELDVNPNTSKLYIGVGGQTQKVIIIDENTNSVIDTVHIDAYGLGHIQDIFISCDVNPITNRIYTYRDLFL